MAKKEKVKKSRKEKGGKVTKKQAVSRRNKNNGKKGKGWQRYAAKILAVATGHNIKDFYTNHGGVKGEEDVHRSEAAQKSFPFWIEAKNAQQLSIGPWWQKLNEDREEAKCDDPGIIISRLFGTSKALVTLDFEVFLHMMYGPMTKQQAEIISQSLKMEKEKEKDQ